MIEQRSELDLQLFLHILRRRLWVVVGVLLLVPATAFVGASLQTPKYRSSADILIARTQAENVFNVQGGVTYTDPNRLLNNQIRVIRSRHLSDLVKQRLGFPAEITASASKTEDVISLSAVSSARNRAAAIVDAYTSAYLEYRRSTSASQNATIQAELRRQIEPAEAQLKALDDELAAAPGDDRELVRTRQADQREVLLGTLTTKKAQLAELESAANVEEGGAQLLVPATVPGAPFEPKVVRTGILALGVGLVLGVALALLVDYLDNRVRGEEDLQRVADDLPVLGMVPTYSRKKYGDSYLISLKEPSSSATEAYRTLRTAIQFVGLDRSLRSLQVTSPSVGDGKTITIANLAVALARAGQRVIVVVGDLRRPRAHEMFGLPSEPGLTSVLVGDAALSSALKPIAGAGVLFVLPAGPLPPNPSELLSGKRVKDLLDRLKSQADIVLIDSPPVLAVSDATVIASRVDATLMVVSVNRTHRKDLARALELLRQVDASVIGAVLNRVDDKRAGYYGYSYSSHNGARPAKPKPTVTEDATAREAVGNGEDLSSAPAGRPRRSTTP